MPVPEHLTWIPGEVPQGAPFNVAQMYRRLGQAIQEDTGAEPDFNSAMNRHRLLECIQQASDRGARQKVS